MTVVMGILVFMIFIFFVYAIVQKGIADEMQRVANETAIKLDKCAEAAIRQQGMAEKATEEARRARQQTEETLQKALKK